MAAAFARVCGARWAAARAAAGAPTREEAAAVARACARLAAARVPTRGLTTSGGAEEWRKANKLVEELLCLVEKKSPTEAELTMMRVLSKDLSEVLKAPPAPPISMQEMKYLVLQNDVSDLKASSTFHNSVSYTVYVTLCCAAIALGGENMRFHVQGDDHQEKINEHDKRLTIVEDKVDVMTQKKEGDARQLKESEAPLGNDTSQLNDASQLKEPEAGWFYSLPKWLKRSNSE